MSKTTEISITQSVGVITGNFEEVKNALQEHLKEYEGAIFTEKSITTGKAVVASLRKERDAFKKRITEIKKAHMMPFEEFKAKADELLELYDKPINFIVEQIDAHVEREKEAKKEVINEIYNFLVSAQIREIIPLSNIFNEKWLNKTTTKKAIQQEIQSLVESVESALNTLGAMQSEARDKAIAMYKANMDLAGALTYINNYELQKAEIVKRQEEEKIQRAIEEERKKQAEIDRLKAEHEEELRQKQEEIQKAASVAVEEFVESITEVVEGEEEKEYEIGLTATESQLKSVCMFLDSIGIEYCYFEKKNNKTIVEVISESNPFDSFEVNPFGEGE